MLQLVAGLTDPEVAAALGMTVGQVKLLRHRGQANPPESSASRALSSRRSPHPGSTPITRRIKRNITGEDVPHSQRTAWSTA
jgi:hypothetical protein